MIKKIVIESFKIHSHLELDLRNLTILTGQNGMGKSSVMQSMLLLRQSANKDGSISAADLKGNLVDLGFAHDIECQSSASKYLNITLGLDEEYELPFKFSYERADTYDTCLPIVGKKPNCKAVMKCSLFSNHFQYISAFRLGPQKGYERDTKIVQTEGQISKHNGTCEYAVHFLAHYGNKIHCNPAFVVKGSDNDLLDTQVRYWMQKVSPRVYVSVEKEAGSYRLNYKYSREGNTMTDNMSAINVGYGISYVLPIVVAILSAEPGSLLLIENPEAHIHPRAQAELMKLVMKAINVGVQIIIETHSDHIMNGVLVNISNDPVCLGKVSAYYFDRNDTSHTSVIKRLDIQDDGRILNPPTGFFDQIDIDMRTIMGF